MTNFKKEKLLDLYKTAYFVRRSEEEIANNYRKGNIRCPTHLSIGQELVPAIISLFKNNSDLAVSSHRSHGHYLGKGGSLPGLFDELHGLETGCSGGNGGSMHLIDTSVGFMGSTAIVANTIPVGVGLASAIKLDRLNNVVYIFLGDGATEEGVFYESIHYASLKKLPCIFIIENNNFSVYTNLKSRQNIPLSQKIKGFGIKYFLNEKNNFLDLYEKMNIALDYSRSAKEPAIIEVMTHRYLEHCGPNSDDHLNYRDKTFLNDWSNLDILENIKLELNKNYISEHTINSINEETDLIVKSTFTESEEKFLLKLKKTK
tara:strand:+ start:2882 stop:3832 length:951 start_codon:yes stop_codon:yes gene_type:complete